jgi:NodT family efflux transporter outer membrane factor (OMF) lipoprotein
MRLVRLLGAVGCVATLGGCDLAPPYHAPTVAVPAAFKEAITAKPSEHARTGPWQPAHPADAAPRGRWWEAYGDPELNRLEVQIEVGNQTLAATLAVYDQARAFAREAEAGLYPTVGLGGTISTNKQSSHRPLRSANQPSYYGANTIDAQADYEVDVWGRVRDFVAAGKAAAQASDADLEEIRLSLHAELADDYVTLRGLDEQIKLLNDTVNAYAKALTLVQNRFRGDIASGVDVAQAETQLASAKAQISDVMSRRQLLEHAIATLIGQPAPAFSLAASAALIPQPDVPPGLPSTLLQRRPDIASAERQVASANQLVGVAEAAFYPSFSLNLVGGLQNTGLNLLSLPLAFWSLGPSVSLPVFEGGLRHAELAGAKAAFEAAAARYRATVLDAFQDVEDNLALLHWLRQAAKDENAAVSAAQRSVSMALTLYRDGAENYLQVITAQTAALSAQQTELDLRTRRLQASIGLIRATGGGWTTADLPSEKAL